MTLDRFVPHLGEAFSVATDSEGEAVARLILSEAKRLPLAETTDRPFRLLFQSFDDLALDQGLYWIAPKGESSEPIFLVPVGSRLYEAVFN